MREIGTVRYLSCDDYDKGYLELLGYLTIVDADKISPVDFCTFVRELDHKHRVYVIADREEKKVLATGTLLIENKIIHGCGKVGHIEDIVVHGDYQRQHIGMKMIQKLTEEAELAGCYKVILDCTDDVSAFYMKCGLHVCGLEMSLYL
ncbi:GNAT family N-acetyltransferase [Entomospira entomophila]|uniref:GNAT family N-acetyltransferase n=1 Tax=Entomospira entomophila TaxID=2719988 RepID=A0A968G992_9SPIO|nr:GNAT family N-acetyltransferase [Entomospira entomophilus]NIZ40923.1 GNAT family N-acetyltransferase [Entomospira entomophilus]WDI35136.1 GNAT family N-acetyltransferase [Entomospira entomophilus]